MPIVIPTADEVERMDARQRAAWRERLGVVRHQVSETTHLLTYGTALGDSIADQARLLYAGCDPDWREHQARLLEAVK